MAGEVRSKGTMVVTGLLATLLIVTPTPYASTETFHWNGELGGGEVIEIVGGHGDVHAERSEGNEVEVIARKRGVDSDPESVMIQVLSHRRGVTICAVYPGWEGRCAPGEAAHAPKDSDVEVEFTVRIPKGVKFVGRTAIGRVEDHRESCCTSECVV